MHAATCSWRQVSEGQAELIVVLNGRKARDIADADRLAAAEDACKKHEGQVRSFEERREAAAKKKASQGQEADAGAAQLVTSESVQEMAKKLAADMMLEMQEQMKNERAAADKKLEEAVRAALAESAKEAGVKKDGEPGPAESEPSPLSQKRFLSQSKFDIFGPQLIRQMFCPQHLRDAIHIPGLMRTRVRSASRRTRLQIRPRREARRSCSRPRRLATPVSRMRAEPELSVIAQGCCASLPNLPRSKS